MEGITTTAAAKSAINNLTKTVKTRMDIGAKMIMVADSKGGARVRF